VRDAARRNVYTGKTYNSLENIAQFFSERGGSPGASKPAANTPPASRPAMPPATQSRPAAAGALARPVTPPKKKPFGSGSVIHHPKYGRGTVLRREGDGDDAKLTVSFPGYGLKKLVEKYAGIRVEE
jgi:DNA helicase-2/ATP-dependent DNA helicase PcrA